MLLTYLHYTEDGDVDFHTMCLTFPKVQLRGSTVTVFDAS